MKTQNGFSVTTVDELITNIANFGGYDINLEAAQYAADGRDMEWIAVKRLEHAMEYFTGDKRTLAYKEINAAYVQLIAGIKYRDTDKHAGTVEFFTEHLAKEFAALTALLTAIDIPVSDDDEDDNDEPVFTVMTLEEKAVECYRTGFEAGYRAHGYTTNFKGDLIDNFGDIIAYKGISPSVLNACYA